MMRPFASLGLLFCVVPMLVAQPAAPERAAAETFFETKVRPILAEHCYLCHGPKKQQGDLRLDRRDTVIKRSDGEPVVVPGQPDKSLLVKAIRHDGDLKMPPRGKLPPEAIADLTHWVKLGAAWPDEKIVKAVAPVEGAIKHWAFQPVRKPTLPVVKQVDWPATAVDHFILAALEAKGLTPNPLADRRTLLRRLKFDLLGLPPTYDEIAAFEADPLPDAYAKRVDAYLASPQHGERWARHWLDVARYADTKGYVFVEERRFPFAYTYRDWVVNAFNDDLPYDQFIVQQLAADRLVAAKQAEPSSQAAMGFLTLGRRFLNNPHDIIDDRIDVVSRGLLGLTVACARCHDHKYDPIPTRDYYSLYGVFASSEEPKELPSLGEPPQTPEYLAYAKKLGTLQQAVKDYETKNKQELEKKNRLFRDGLIALKRKVDAFQATSAAAPPRAMALADLPQPREPHVLLRGNPSNVGPAVPRQFLEVLAGPERQPFRAGSGRLELARAIASPANPLTARVLVNRLWLHHFGAGLVTTPSDFGVRSEPPSHPALLDYLAATFVEEGWSLKKLHRQLVLSKVYQLSSAAAPAAQAVDPENRLLARANRRRLDFEAMRDSLLAVGGNLDPKLGGPAVEITTSLYSQRRTVYAFIERQNLPGLFRTFDFASPDTTTAQRYRTTVPQQALFMLNHPFLQVQVRTLLRRHEIASAGEPAVKMQALHRVLYGRAADADEVQLGQRFLDTTAGLPGPAGPQALTAWERYGQVLLLANEFMFVD